jgi:endonuclease/exonuclease/phosphatase family metal-dependent hydrolase
MHCRCAIAGSASRGPELTGRRVRVLVWNLFHGRSLPPSPDGLKARFFELLGAWEWEVALLQEVPPWWPSRLGRAVGAESCAALTSRNAGLRLRRALAERWPELLKSNGGGCNAVLVQGQIATCRSLRLRTWPERRVAQLVRLRDGSCIVNYHGSSRADRAQAELERLCDHALAWAGGSPLILGGDLNLRDPQTPAELVHLASRDVDHLFARGLVAQSPPHLLERTVAHGQTQVELSDHLPILAELAAAPPGAGS